MPNAARHGVFRHASIVMFGALTAQTIGLLASPLLTRLYEPSTYGVFGVFVAATALLVPISAWTLETAIALPKSQPRGAHVLLAALMAVLVTSSLVAAAALLSGPSLLHALSLEELAPYLPLLPVYVLIGGTNLTLGFWFVRRRRFVWLSSARVAQSIGTAATQLGLGFAGALSGGLILGSLAGQVAAVLVALATIPKRETGAAARLATRAGWGWVYRAYGDFPRLKVPQRLLAAASDTVLVVGLSVAFSPAHAGYFALMRRVLSLPAELVGESVRKALIPTVAETASSAPVELTRMLARSSLTLLATALLPIAVLVAAGPFMFGLVFGAAWETAGAYARIVVLMVAVRFAAVPYLTCIPVLRLNRVHLQADALRFAATGAAFAIGMLLDNLILGLIGYAAAGMASDAVAVGAVRRRLAAMIRGPRPL